MTGKGAVVSYGRVVGEIATRNKRLLGALGALLLLGMMPAATADAPLPPVTEADGRLGTCYSGYTAAFAGLAHEAGSRWDRFDFRWSVIQESEHGGFNWGPHDTLVDRVRAEGLNVIGILGSTPAWAVNTIECPETAVQGIPDATSTPSFGVQWEGGSGWPDHCPPASRYELWNGPGGANAWGNYVYATVMHFKDRVAVWEIWNEPDAAYFWRGTCYAYAHVLKVAYRAVQAADPDATVLFGGLAYWDAEKGTTTFHLEVLDLLANDAAGAAHNYYFDAMSLHLYANVYQTHDVVRAVQNDVAARVGPHPLWLTEMGVKIWPEGEPCPPDASECPPHYSAEENEAAAYVIAAYANARAADVERALFFRLHDDTGGMLGQRYGLVRDDYSLRPAYVAYQVAARYLRDENQVTGPFDNGPVRRVTFWGTPHGRIDVLWNRTPTATTYLHPALLPTAVRVDVEGQTETLAAADGHVALSLAGATSNRNPAGEYTIGGPPVLLIHPDTEPPRSQPAPLPALVTTPIVTVTWAVTDTGAGYWYAQVARAPAADGPWTTVADWSTTRNVTATQVSLPSAGAWHLRLRTRDNAGNWEAWPPTAQVATTYNATRTVTLSATAFSDPNHDGQQTGDEPALPDAEFHWEDGAGARIATLTGGETVTETVAVGAYRLRAWAPDHLPATYAFDVPPGETPQVVTWTAALHPVVARVYLPLITRGTP